jgi:hypothetical protein
MFYRNFTEEQMSSIISYIIGGEKFRAISAYRDLDKEASSEDVILRVIEVASKVSEWLNNPEFALKHIPSVCCLNCTGICGRWKEKTKNGGFNKSSCKFEGAECCEFNPVEDFIKNNKDSQISLIKNKNESKCEYDMVKIKVENKICSISHEVFNYRQKRLIKTKKRILLVDSEDMLKHVVSLIRKGYQIYCNEAVPVTLTIAGKNPLKKDKDYKSYFHRCQEEIRENNKKVEKQVYGMSYEDACTEFLKTATASEKSIIASLGGNVKNYISMFYPGQSVWQVVEQLKKNQ